MSKLNLHIILENRSDVDLHYQAMKRIVEQTHKGTALHGYAKNICRVLEPMVSAGLGYSELVSGDKEKPNA